MRLPAGLAIDLTGRNGCGADLVLSEFPSIRRDRAWASVGGPEGCLARRNRGNAR
jgi:hypothetical protein